MHMPQRPAQHHAQVTRRGRTHDLYSYTELRPCRRCGKEKHFTEFALGTAREGGGRYLNTICLPCANDQTKESRYGKGATKVLLTPCDVCGDEATVIDHCHAGGHVRGGLCRLCNVGLGHFRDDPALLRKAADYLEGKE